MNLQILVDIIKYLVVGILVYTVFKYIPSQKLAENDVLLIAVLIMLLYIGFDSVQKLFYQPSNSTDISSCSKYCSVLPEKVENFSTMLVEESEPNINKIVEPQKSPEIIQPQSNKKVISETKSRDGTITRRYADNSYSVSPANDPNITRGTPRYISGVMTNELAYDKDYPFFDLTTLPFPEGVNPDDLYEEGYSFLPPKDWYPVPPHPPICVTNKQSTVCPTLTTGLGIDLKEWNESRRVTGPDSINTQYIKDKLNSGA
jgi:hypothetical protein